jgi:fatty-acyl-CoA synthase
MSERRIVATPSAYSYPLLIKQLLHTSLMQSPQQEIVYRDVKRLSYADLRDRIGRLGSAPAKIGVRPGDTVGVLDWDSNRFLEAFFAIPMMRAIL